MAKLQIKSETIATFGGVFPIMDVFEHIGLSNLIDSTFGKRDASWNSFKYSDVIETLFCNYLSCGDCLEDINMLAPQFSLRPNTRIPSSETVGRVLKSLATENISYARLLVLSGKRIDGTDRRSVPSIFVQKLKNQRKSLVVWWECRIFAEKK